MFWGIFLTRPNHFLQGDTIVPAVSKIDIRNTDVYICALSVLSHPTTPPPPPPSPQTSALDGRNIDAAFQYLCSHALTRKILDQPVRAAAASVSGSGRSAAGSIVNPSPGMNGYLICSFRPGLFFFKLVQSLAQFFLYIASRFLKLACVCGIIVEAESLPGSNAGTMIRGRGSSSGYSSASEPQGSGESNPKVTLSFNDEAGAASTPPSSSCCWWWRCCFSREGGLCFVYTRCSCLRDVRLFYLGINTIQCRLSWSGTYCMYCISVCNGSKSDFCLFVWWFVYLFVCLHIVVLSLLFAERFKEFDQLR